MGKSYVVVSLFRDGQKNYKNGPKIVIEWTLLRSTSKMCSYSHEMHCLIGPSGRLWSAVALDLAAAAATGRLWSAVALGLAAAAATGEWGPTSTQAVPLPLYLSL